MLELIARANLFKSELIEHHTDLKLVVSEKEYEMYSKMYVDELESLKKVIREGKILKKRLEKEEREKKNKKVREERDERDRKEREERDEREKKEKAAREERDRRNRADKKAQEDRDRAEKEEMDRRGRAEKEEKEKLLREESDKKEKKMCHICAEKVVNECREFKQDNDLNSLRTVDDIRQCLFEAKSVKSRLMGVRTDCQNILSDDDFGKINRHIDEELRWLQNYVSEGKEIKNDLELELQSIEIWKQREAEEKEEQVRVERERKEELERSAKENELAERNQVRLTESTLRSTKLNICLII